MNPVERPKRRRFSAEYKLAILREADACVKQGELGALLRREALYSSHLSTWRHQREAGALKELSRQRGPCPPIHAVPRSRRCAGAPSGPRPSRPRRARVIEVQGNVSALLEDLLGTEGAAESTER